MITNMMITTPQDTPGKIASRKVGQSHFLMAMDNLALTQLAADALITFDRQLADAVKDPVTVAPIEALY